MSFPRGIILFITHTTEKAEKMHQIAIKKKEKGFLRYYKFRFFEMKQTCIFNTCKMKNVWNMFKMIV